MMNKKSMFVLVFIVLLTIVPFVSAQGAFSQQVNNFVEGLSSIIEPIAKLLLGSVAAEGTFSSSDILWSKALFLILIFCVVYVAFQRSSFFSTNSTAHFLVTAVVSLLATRWLGGSDAIQALLLPYTALGIALSAALPFVAWFLIINVGMRGSVPTVRRTAWILFGVSFIFLWASRVSDLADSSIFWIYPITSVLSFIMAWQDGTIRRFWLKVNLENIEKNTAEEGKIYLTQKLAEVDRLEAEGLLTPEESIKRRKKLRDRLKYFSTR